MDLCLGQDLGLKADLVKAHKRLSDEKTTSPHFESHVLGFFSQLLFACSLAESQVERGGRLLFEHPWGGDVVERTVLEKVVGDRWHVQGPMRKMSVRNDLGMTMRGTWCRLARPQG